MKLQVILRTFGVPILLAIILIIRVSTGLDSFRIFFETVFVVSVSLSRLLSEDKYIRSVTVVDDRINITYYTRFLQLKSFERPLSEITSTRLSRRLSIAAIWSPVLEVKVDDEWLGYYIVTKRLYNVVRQQVQTAKPVPGETEIPEKG